VNEPLFSRRVEIMSYERQMLVHFAMPPQQKVAAGLLRVLFKHGGCVKEFGAGQEIVDEMADDFALTPAQRSAFLETTYRKENRVKKAYLWHRLLFRAANALADQYMVSRPTQTFQLTGQREWMLTEKGFDAALRQAHIPRHQKDLLATKSFESQKVAQKLLSAQRPENYEPFDRTKKSTTTTRAALLRTRGFRQAVIEAYDFRCAVCGLKICAPAALTWEVEAAHIVPHRAQGRDDIFNGLALCGLHHWAFDVGWFTLLDDYHVQVSSQRKRLPSDFGKLESFDFLHALADKKQSIHLPRSRAIYPPRQCPALAPAKHFLRRNTVRKRGDDHGQ
jgi:hypothetical protein